MKLRSIIVDDSTLQQTIVEKLINNHPKLMLSGKYESALAANRHLKDDETDLMFLDVEMPLLSGFEFLESLKNPPLTILISKKPDYALKAFDYNVAYYLLKPISPVRFNLAATKVIKKFELLHSINEEAEYVFVKSNLKKTKIFLNDIRWVEAIGDYIKIVTGKRNIIVLTTMKRFEKILPAKRFLRIHRSYIANLKRIERVGCNNVQIDNHVLPISRNKKELLLDKLMSV